ncbi:ABC transporter permease [Streptomyces sp. NPDC056160]|uniref:ABC transporter permease n=1 Tax=Streptomyces sp. NPDC056160 TaxID=3345731 RepID=UPI0035E273A0
MTTSTAPPEAASVTAAGRTPSGPRVRAVLALARVESRELARQAVVLLFFAVYVAATAWRTYSGHAGWHAGHEGMADHPALQDADRATQSGALLLGVALFVCADRAVLRSRRRGTEEQLGVLVMEPWRRTLAHALSVVPFALFTALVVAVRFTSDALRAGAVGHGSAAELAVAPLTVLLCGVAGVLLARLVPSWFAALLVVVAGFMAPAFLGVGAGGAHWVQWLAPVVTETGSDPLPSGLVGRPAAWHALYLAGLAALLLGAALLRSGGRTVRVKAFAVLALAATAAGIAGQSPGPSAALQAARARVSEHPEAVESCAARGTTTYCALPEWTGRTDAWAKTADRVRSLAGGTAATRPLTVRQRVEARYGLDGGGAYDPLTAPGTATVGTRWGGNRVPEFSVGLASVLVAGDERAGAEVCDGRVVTVMWLALGAAPDPVTALRDVRLDDSLEGGSYVLTPTGGLRMSAAQTEVVRALLHRPRQEAASAVKSHWAELTAPGTSTARVADLLDVPGVSHAKGAGDACER